MERRSCSVAQMEARWRRCHPTTVRDLVLSRREHLEPQKFRTFSSRCSLRTMPVSPSNDFRGQSATGNGSLQMRVVDPLCEPAWDHVVSLHRDASCFHTSAWAKVLHHTYKHEPFYLQFFHRRRLAAVVPLMEIRSPFTGRRGVCLPFSDSCEPLIFEPDMVGVVRDRLLSFAQERRWHYLEIRGGKLFQLAPAAASRFYGHALDLTD